MYRKLLLLPISLLCINTAGAQLKEDPVVTYEVRKPVCPHVADPTDKAHVNCDAQTASEAGEQAACPESLSKQQKLAQFCNLLDDILLLNWNEREAEHIQTLKSLINRYSEHILAGNQPGEEFQTQFDQWIEYAEKELGWPESKIYSVLTGEITIPERIEYLPDEE